MDPIHQFKVQTLIPLHLGSLDLSITNSSLWMMLVVGFIGLISLLFKPKKVPTRLQFCFEKLLMFLQKVIRDNVGTEGLRFFPYILSLFLFIIMGNLAGLLPYSFTYTSQIVVTIGLAMGVFMMTIIVGFWKHGLSFLRLFLPHGTPFYIAPLLVPIEIISFLSRPFSLGIRLFANMVAGHAMLKIFAGFAILLWGFVGGFLSLLPFVGTMMIFAFEILVAVLQAYVFTVLTCIYLHDALHLHE